MNRQIVCAQRKPRMIAMKVTGTGTAAITIGAFEGTLVDNGAGSYTITFAQAFQRVPVAVASAMTATIYCEISALSATAVTVLCKTTAANVATDAIFNLMVMGFDAADEV